MLGAAALLVFLSYGALGQVADTIARRTASMQALPGFMPLYWDAKEGKLWLEIGLWDTDFLYVVSLPAGVGSNPIGLDRGQLGGTYLVQFRRVGPTVLLVEPNLSYRAESPSLAERTAVAESFAESVHAGFKVSLESGTRVLVDATEFFLRDAHDVVGTLKRTNQGTYSLDTKRSAFYLARTKGFADNTEVEVTLTFSGKDPGSDLRSVVPTPEALTVRQHHSFVRLPALGSFQPRRFDPRAGYFSINYADYAKPIDAPLVQRYICRHRLEKQDPTAAVSKATKPIVYYLDPGTPEPIRSALLEGARWWNQAFEAAGFQDAFRVELLPEGADPLDIRYNMIHWVHRSTRGWSYGASVVDPRTGEILKGNVSLGSLRVRQDFLIASALRAPYGDTNTTQPHLQLALARLRQLSAHEVGHTLGLVHNYHASTQNRASVMDYPHPRIVFRDQKLTFDDAYATGIGTWDKLAIRYGYTPFASPEAEAKGLEAILQEGLQSGNYLISDADARPLGGAHPTAHLWDENEPLKELNRVMSLRRQALAAFSEANIAPGQPLATLEETLVPLYLLHRYQAEAVVKLIGGVDYRYNVRGDDQPGPRPLPAATQREALQLLLTTLMPMQLELPTHIRNLIPPRPLGYGGAQEVFNRATGPTFDPLAPAAAYISLVIDGLLHPNRLERLYQQGFERNQLELAELLKTLFDASNTTGVTDAYHRALGSQLRFQVLRACLAVVQDERLSDPARAVVFAALDRYRVALGPVSTTASPDDQYARWLFEDWREHPERYRKAPETEVPPGAPIGCEE